MPAQVAVVCKGCRADLDHRPSREQERRRSHRRRHHRSHESRHEIRRTSANESGLSVQDHADHEGELTSASSCAQDPEISLPVISGRNAVLGALALELGEEIKVTTEHLDVVVHKLQSSPLPAIRERVLREDALTGRYLRGQSHVSDPDRVLARQQSPDAGEATGVDVAASASEDSLLAYELLEVVGARGRGFLAGFSVCAVILNDGPDSSLAVRIISAALVMICLVASLDALSRALAAAEALVYLRAALPTGALSDVALFSPRPFIRGVGRVVVPEPAPVGVRAGAAIAVYISLLIIVLISAATSEAPIPRADLNQLIDGNISASTRSTNASTAQPYDITLTSWWRGTDWSDAYIAVSYARLALAVLGWLIAP